jgi:hypothetical protein
VCPSSEVDERFVSGQVQIKRKLESQKLKLPKEIYSYRHRPTKSHDRFAKQKKERKNRTLKN